MDAGTRKEKKSYALTRMAQAISRAIDAPGDADKQRAARWAAAWGVVAGIRSKGIRLRRSCVSGVDNKGCQARAGH